MVRIRPGRVAAWLGLVAGMTLLGAAAHAAPVEVGQPAPDFNLPDQNGVMHKLADYKGKFLVLAFYPKDFTGG